MAISGTFVGLPAVTRALRQLPEAARDQTQGVMDVSAFNVSRGAQSRAKRRTGVLADNIAWASRPRTLSAVVGVRRLAFYWKFLEYGTVKMPAQPFLRPAAEAERSDHSKRLTLALQRALTAMVQSSSRGGGT